MNLLNLDVGATDYEGEAAKRRKVLESLGVTEEHDVRQQAPAPTQNGLPPQGQQRQPEGLMFPDGAPQRPMTKGHQEYLENPMTALLKRFVIPKSIYKQMYGANEEYLGQMADYKLKSEAYEAHQERLATSGFAQPYRSMLQNDDKDDDLQALEELAILQPKIYGPVLRDYQTNRLAPTPATYTEGDFQLIDGEWTLVQQGSDGQIKKTPMGPDFTPESRMWSPDARETAIGKADEEAFKSQGRLSNISSLGAKMDEIGEENWTAGIKGELGDEWKELTGAQDALSMARKQYEGIRTTQAIQNLPPGVASDKDINLVMKPFPTAFTNFAELRQYVTDMEKIERKVQAYRQFESRYLAAKGTRSGMLQTWRERQTELESTEGSPFYEGEKGTVEDSSIEAILEDLGV